MTVPQQVNLFEYSPCTNRLALYSSVKDSFNNYLPSPSNIERTNTGLWRHSWRSYYLESLPFEKSQKKDIKTAQIICAECKKPLVKSFLNVFQMPSEGWMELVECWSCHKDEFAVVTPDAMQAQPGNMLLGVDEVIIHKDDMAPCDCLLLVSMEGQNALFDLETILIDGLDTSIGTVLKKTLLSLYEMHGSWIYNFTCDQDSFYIWLASWNVIVGSQISDLLPALKIGYSVQLPNTLSTKKSCSFKRIRSIKNFLENSVILEQFTWNGCQWKMLHL